MKVLILTKDYLPNKWASVEEAALFVCKDLVIHSFGDEITLHGGINADGERSTLTFHSILVVNGIAKQKYMYKPSLSNRALYKRDLYTCAYCGNVFISADLSRDHVIPVSKKGKNTWDNVVTACKPCNRRKGDTLLKDMDSELLFKPYHPTKAEELLMFSKPDEVTDEQVKLLISQIKHHSRVKNVWIKELENDHDPVI